MKSKKKRRKTVGTDVRATKVYPLTGSSKSETADVNIMVSDSDALRLARHLIQAAMETCDITIRAIRTPGKDGSHRVTLAYEVNDEKLGGGI